MYLLDTCVPLELLLEQERAGEVAALLKNPPSIPLCISDFSISSLGIFCLRRGKEEAFLRFVNDLMSSDVIQMIRLGLSDMKDVLAAARRYGFLFDDAYQYTVAKKNNLTIVTFDAHFDRTDRKRKTPRELLRE
jgi:predicted nucleic acid-binding protein